VTVVDRPDWRTVGPGSSDERSPQTGTSYKYIPSDRSCMSDSHRSVGDADESSPLSLATSVLIAIRSSFLVFVSTVGVGLLFLSVVVSGFVLPGVDYGIISAMAFIWGVSALVYAVLGRFALKLIGYS
jgi:hypothetical protein